MIRVDITLDSFITGEKSHLGTLVIYNDGTSKDPQIGNYVVMTGRRGQDLVAAIHRKPQRKSEVKEHRRQALSVWTLVAKALKALEY